MMPEQTPEIFREIFREILRPRRTVARALRRGLCAAVLLALPGCVTEGGGVHRTIVADGRVAIVAPYGFCVDESASRDDEDGAFVLLASCAALTRGAEAAVPAEDAILTVSVAPSPGPGGSPEDRALVLRRYFASELGRAVLARSGDPADVELLGTDTRGAVFLVHSVDRGPGLAEGLRPDSWRAVFEANGRIVTAAATGFASRPIGDQSARALLQDLAGRSRAATASLPDPTMAPSAASGAAPVPGGRSD
ncbi:hypothetical protein [Rhodovulum sp. MB263]|uniref:hypothetical protein n=1 Tax=Rhodovulum sp. (strain MB263) TaxID=308754 RepID=UPI0009B72016|nr:hypothetical protein [Rhodovulum sp. MB263]ARC87311.1 hypothetical protein B5V46_01035 [Rhodovulum sp. MB263]